MSNITEKGIGFVGAGKVGVTLAFLARRTGLRVSLKAKNPPPSPLRAKIEKHGIFLTQDAGKFLSLSETVIICTSEKDIPAVVSELFKFKEDQHAIAHTSGSLSRSALNEILNNKTEISVFHPYRSFPEIQTDLCSLKGFMVGISSLEKNFKTFSDLAKKLGAEPVPIEDEFLPLYHASAVLLVEAAVKGVSAAVEFLEKSGVEEKKARKFTAGFMKDVLKNIEKNGPAKARTGPAARGETEIFKRHFSAVAEWCPEKLELFKQLLKPIGK